MKYHNRKSKLSNRKNKKAGRIDLSLVSNRQPTTKPAVEPVTNARSEMPPEVEAEIMAGKAAFEQMLAEGPKDENYERILAAMEEAIIEQDEQQKLNDRYVFDPAEFADACKHVVADQLSAIKKEKIDSKEFATRFNRWFTFCDAVVNLGISCLYAQESLKYRKYEEVFRTLRINKAFDNAMLKPHGIKVELRHKSKMVMSKYPWLAMPVLVIKDEQGVEHEVAITPSPSGTVWWLDILAGFHGSYDWVIAPQFDETEDYIPVSTLDEPYPEGTIRNAPTPDDELPTNDALRHYGISSILNPVNKKAPSMDQAPGQDWIVKLPPHLYQSPVVGERNEAKPPYKVHQNGDLCELLAQATADNPPKQGLLSRLWTKIRKVYGW